MPDYVKAAVLDEVELSHQQAITADETDKIRIHLAVEQGVTTREIAERLGMKQSTVSDWRRQGREALERRRNEDSGRSGESGEDG